MAGKKPEERPGLVEQLKQAIQQSGQTLNQLSLKCGVGRDRLSRFLRGERDLTLEAAEKVVRDAMRHDPSNRMLRLLRLRLAVVGMREKLAVAWGRAWRWGRGLKVS